MAKNQSWFMRCEMVGLRFSCSVIGASVTGELAASVVRVPMAAYSEQSDSSRIVFEICFIHWQ